MIDRVALTLGLDAVTVPDDDGRGRAYVGGIADVTGCPARLQTYLQTKGWSWDRYLD